MTTRLRTIPRQRGFYIRQRPGRVLEDRQRKPSRCGGCVRLGEKLQGVYRIIDRGRCLFVEP